MECREKGGRAGRADSVRGVKRDHMEEIKTLASLTHAENGRMDEERENMEIKRSR